MLKETGRTDESLTETGKAILRCTLMLLTAIVFLGLFTQSCGV